MFLSFDLLLITALALFMLNCIECRL